MPTIISVRRNYSVVALLDIHDPEFANWYGLGVWWSMYGDYQATGPYRDQYLIRTIIRHIRDGWYDKPDSGWFGMVGFNLGMVHGGWLIKPIDTLVVLTDEEFTNGYYAGRDYCFSEATEYPSDTCLVNHLYTWAQEYTAWQEPEATLRYSLGCRIGELSGAVLPLTADELSFDGSVKSTAVIRLVK